jgi:hypothetical protein
MLITSGVLVHELHQRATAIAARHVETQRASMLTV